MVVAYDRRDRRRQTRRGEDHTRIRRRQTHRPGRVHSAGTDVPPQGTETRWSTRWFTQFLNPLAIGVRSTPRTEYESLCPLRPIDLCILFSNNSPPCTCIPQRELTIYAS